MAVLIGGARILRRLTAIQEALSGLAAFSGRSEAAAAKTERNLEERIENVVRAVEHAIRRQDQQQALLDRLLGAQSTYLGDHVALTFLQDGQRIFVDTRDVGIGSHLLSLGQWEPEYAAAFRRLLRPGSRVLDLGANHGTYTMLAAAVVGPAGIVHAFEANPRLALLTERSVSINGHAGYVRVHALAVGEAEGQAVLVFDDAWSGGGSVQGGVPGTGTPCRVAALDDLFPDPGFVVDVVKMDMEGSEGRALRGMRRLLGRSPQVRIMMEFAPGLLSDVGTPPSDVVALLQGMGFRAWTIQHDASLEPAAWEGLAALSGGVRNVVLCRDDLT